VNCHGTFFQIIWMRKQWRWEVQTLISITKPEGKTVLINCHVSSHDFSNVFIHWYQKRVNEAPKRIAYMFSRFFLEDQSDEGKFTVEKDPSKSVCSLTVSNVTL
uniref:Ig-like domain-containing protein n=1 Tax=Serinus canaria TaxID=9135 RepID=A0A8C9NUR6_SERCA